MKQFTVTQAEAGQRLDKFLGKYLNKAPKSFLYKMMRKKNITLNGKKAAGSEKLVSGDEIKLFFSDETIEKFSELQLPKAQGKLSVIYEDEHILLVNKPEGILSQKAEADDISMVEEAQRYLLNNGAVTEESLRTFRPSVVNRLDRNTSGILAVGKDLAGAQELSRLFKERSLHKYYYCLVKGQVKEKARIKGYLVKNEATNRVTVEKEPIGKDSLPIETEYTPVDSDGELTLLKVLLVTGRTHQIRAHLSSIGHPILGDHKYGDPALNGRAKEEYHLTHQLLHAAILTFQRLRKIPVHADPFSKDPDSAGAGRQEPADTFHENGLAGTVVSHNAINLPALHDQIDFFQYQILSEAFRHALDLHAGFCHMLPPVHT